MKHLARYLLLASLASHVAAGNTLIVSTTGDSGAGTLRSQISAAANGDTVQVSVSGTITLTNEIAVAGKNISILGPGAGSLTITTAGKSRALKIDNGQTLISGFTFNNCCSTSSIVEAGGAIGIDNFTLGGVSNITTITDCAFVNNRSGWGGAVDIFQGGLAMSGCTFLSNRCSGAAFGTDGGGGALSLGVTVPSSIANCTFTANSQGGTATNQPGGGAVYNFGATAGDPAPVTFEHCTFVANVDLAGPAGAIKGNYSASYHTLANLKNCLLVANQAPAGSPLNFAGPSTSFSSLGGNCTDEQTSSTNVLKSANDLVNSALLSASVAALADNGGPTKTHALSHGSPARGRAVASTMSVDQRGAPRDAQADSGAYERVTPQLSVTVDDAVVIPGDEVVFGPSPIDSPVAKIVTISNAQTSAFVVGPMSVGGLVVPGGYGTAGFSPASLANGQATAFSVTLDASSPGIRNGTLSFTNEDSSFAIQLAGLITDSLDHWRKQHFGPDADNSGASADDAAPMGDGIPNLIKYALGLDPGTSYPANMNIRTDLTPEGALRMTVMRNPSATDLAMSIEVNGNLQEGDGWSTADADVDQNSWTVLQAHDANPSDDKRFIRLNVKGP